MSRWEMSRRDIYLDAMLRHLGAAYYDSLHGRAAPADVTRAVDQVAERLARDTDGVVDVINKISLAPDSKAGRGEIMW